MNTEDSNLELVESEESLIDGLTDKLEDAAIPAYQVELDPDEAENLGAFTEDAISENEALDSSPDQVD